MKEILVGKEYKNAFESVCKLLKGSVPYVDVHVKEVDEKERKIVTQTHIFKYSEEALSSAASGSAMCFTPAGASWFAGLRSGEKETGDGTAQWLSFIESVAKAYHKEYSLLEFKQSASAIDEEDERRCRNVLESVLALFFSSLPGAQISGAREKSVPDDIYGISLKAEISGGTGASVPVLGSVYFRMRGGAAGGKLVPIPAEEAEEIYKSLYSVIPEGNSSRVDSSGSSSLIDAAIFALDQLLKGKSERTFDECIMFGERDMQTVNELAEKLSHDEACLDCRNISVLGISHVRWTSNAYFVYRGDKRVLRAMVSINGSITLMCENCGTGGALIDNDKIVCRYRDRYGNPVREEIVIKPAEYNLGLTQEQVDKILKYSEISKHLQSITCAKNPRVQGGCTRCVCAVQLQNMGTAEKPVMACKDCPYPEMVYEDGEGGLHYTPNTSFARDKMTMTEEEVRECVYCGRKFSAAVMENTNACPLCSSRSKNEEEGKKRYSKYASVFSPITRIRYIGKRKMCFEDEDMMVFFMGQDRYILDKKDLEKDGYLPAPITPARRRQKALSGGKEGRK